MKIDIIGRGNVGSHLLSAWEGKADVAAVNSRTMEGLRSDADVALIAVSDNAIGEVALKADSLYSTSTVIAHTSGATPLSVISGLIRPTGVLYPLQTFSRQRVLEYSEIPVLIEGSDGNALNILSSAARIWSGRVQEMDSLSRLKLHLGSVLACNFANHLWMLSDRYLGRHGIDFNLLVPLIRETAAKLSDLKPKDAQTGPALRGDTKTIVRHLDLLEDDAQLNKIYAKFTDSIIKNHQISPQ